MAFMIPEYYADAPFQVETSAGTWIVPSDVCSGRDPSDFVDYVEGTPTEVERLPMGVVFRLSAPGLYLDCTDWNYAPTLEAARAGIVEQYEVDPDTGDEPGEEEEDA